MMNDPQDHRIGCGCSSCLDIDASPPPSEREQTKNDALDFNTLREKSIRRSEMILHGDLGEWSETDWACAAAGEMGEMCNLIKKRRRGELATIEGINAVADEAADCVIYLDLLMARMGVDLGAAVRRKFNEVSDRRDIGIKL